MPCLGKDMIKNILKAYPKTYAAITLFTQMIGTSKSNQRLFSLAKVNNIALSAL